MVKTASIALGGILIVVGAAVALRTLTTEAPANIVLVSIDTLRADHLGCYGYESDTSPFLDALAKEGIRFANAFSQSSWTLPSHASLMTSQYPQVHRAETERRGLPASSRMLAETLKSAGYESAGFVTHWFVSERFGFARGFDTFESLLEPEHLSKAEFITGRVLRWIEKPHDRPFFLFVHYFDPHMGYEPPPPYDTLFDPDYTGSLDGKYESLEKYIKSINANPKSIAPRDLAHVTALYDGEIRYTDTQLKRVYDALNDAGDLDHTLFIVTGDHGEEHNDHGSMEGHGWTLYDEIVRVPLIMRLPRRAYGGRTVDDIVESIDIAPTILDIVGIRTPDSFQGRSVLPLLSRRKAKGADGRAFAISKRFESLKASVRDSRYKLIYTGDTGPNKWGISAIPGFELYDLTSDPGEQSSIPAETRPAGRELIKALYQWLELGPAAAVEDDVGKPVHFTPEELERLRSMGYIGFGDGAESSESPASDAD